MAKRRYKLSEFKERKRAEDLVEIETDDGQVFTVDPVSLWSDDVLALKNDAVATARKLMGDEQYDAFVRAGGSAMIVHAMLGDDQSVSAGESSASQPS